VASALSMSACTTSAPPATGATAERAPSAAAPASDTAAEQAAHKAHDAYVAGINSNDLDTFLATISDDAVFLPPNSEPISGKAAVGEWVKGYLAAYETKWVKTSKEFEVRGDLAYEWYVYESTDTPKAGGPAAGTPVVTDTGNGINIYRRGTDGVWRVSRDAWTTTRKAGA
jgi:ketosteroid isomerase-like protein